MKRHGVWNKLDKVERHQRECAFLSDWRVELPCKYFDCGQTKYKTKVWSKLHNQWRWHKHRHRCASFVFDNLSFFRTYVHTRDASTSAYTSTRTFTPTMQVMQVMQAKMVWMRFYFYFFELASVFVSPPFTNNFLYAFTLIFIALASVFAL